MDASRGIKTGLLLLLLWAADLQTAGAHELCESCDVLVGAGGTYHFWGTTGSLVLPVSVTWSEDRYELGIFRFANQQLLTPPGLRQGRHLANPYWGTSLSYRWHIFEYGPVHGFFGFGLAGRTASDTLSASRWDFASQLGVRVRLPGNRAIADLSARHWSNGGIRLPNHGQDFATLTIRLDSGPFGAGADQFTIAPSFTLERARAAVDLGLERQGLP